jgi:uncharacterized membrane protein YeaQ/YmgE (transglycosylase-associated protein family)
MGTFLISLDTANHGSLTASPRGHNLLSTISWARCSRQKNDEFSRRLAMLSNLIWWAVVGLIAGWAAGQLMKGGGYGVVMDIVLGIVGAVIGGWLLGALGIYAGGFIGTIVVAIIGAVFLIWITRLLKKA